MPYPWLGVLGTWVALAALTGALGLVLRSFRPRTSRPASRRAWGRWVGALAYAVVLLAVTFTGFTTDIPGYDYVPPLFAAVTGVDLLCCGVVRAAGVLRGAPGCSGVLRGAPEMTARSPGGVVRERNFT